jgi:hypothetical protein
MQVLFEAKKKLSYSNRLTRVYFSDITFFILAVLVIIIIRRVSPESGFWTYFLIVGIGLLIRMYSSHLEARIYVTKVAFSNGKIDVEYLFINNERQHSFSIENIPFYENASSNTGARIFFNLPNNERFVQYFIGEWNEDSALDLIASLDRIRNTVQAA